MKRFLSEKVTGLKPSGIRKFFDIVSEMKDAISLGVGEPDFDTPWHIRDEGIYSLEKGRTFYTSNAGLKELKMEISKSWKIMACKSQTKSLFLEKLIPIKDYSSKDVLL